MFDKHLVLVLMEKIKGAAEATVIAVNRSRKTKKKPIPLNTISMHKLASKKLHFSASKTMELAERLYNKGLISYPRTETNVYAPSIDLAAIVKELT